MKTRKTVPGAALLLVALAIGGFAPALHAAPPNVVLIVTDDQGYGDLGCHGNPILRTPHLDRLHAESVRLTDFHASPLCAPTRGALLTGRSALRNGAWGVVNGRAILRRDEVTMPEVFAASGYRTGLFGKWHLGDNYPFRPQDRGFHEVVTYGGGGLGTSPDYWGNDYTDDTYLRDGAPEKFPGYSTDILFAEALRFIERNRSRPFYCQLATAAPHDPYNVPERYAKPYAGKVPPATANFFGMIANLDENLGRFRERLAALGLAENTLLIFMTDNGSSGGTRVHNAGMRGAKASNLEGGHRVPCFLHWPTGGLTGGRDIGTLTAHVDVLPTLVEFCGLRLPRPVAFEGRSLVPLLRGQVEGWPERTLIVDTQPFDLPQMWHNSAVMRGPWRLLNGRQLYHVGRDPEQLRDVAAEQDDLVRRLRADYEELWREVEPTFGDTPRITLGHPTANPVWLSPWDLHGQCVYMQYQVEQAERADGWWEVDVANAGEYAITLRRWPPEVRRPLREGLKVTRLTKEGAAPQTIAGATRCRVNVAGLDLRSPIPPDAEEVTLTARLPAGPARLQAWFINDAVIGGTTFGVYYVGVRKR
jgi:arylsulfatase A-like enzyme